MIRVRSILLVLGASGLGGPLVAQGRPAVLIEATAGIGVAADMRSHNDHVGLAFEATAGWRLRPELGRTVVVAISGGTQASMGSIDTCEPAPDGGCARDYRRFHGVAALAGWEVRAFRGASLRALAGPAYYRAGARDGTTRDGLGLQGRIDIATPAVGRVGLLATVRAGAPFERFDDRIYRFGALTAGFRLQ